MLEISEETNEEFFKNKSNADFTHQDLGTITIHNDHEQEILAKYLEELSAGDDFYKPPELKFE